MKRCHKCGSSVTLEFISRRDECPVCRSDLRVCFNCVFHDQVKANQCMEPQAEPVKEKDRANYCDYFRFREQGRQKTGKEEAEKLWTSLFGKP